MPGSQRDYLRPQLCDFGHSCIYQRVGSVNSGPARWPLRCAQRSRMSRGQKLTVKAIRMRSIQSATAALR
jgi:hypothetical protein